MFLILFVVYFYLILFRFNISVFLLLFLSLIYFYSKMNHYSEAELVLPAGSDRIVLHQHSKTV